MRRPFRTPFGACRNRTVTAIITNMIASDTQPTIRMDRMFRAFADRTRLRILILLQEGELCVSDLIAILRVPQAKASHHLNYLRRAGLVEVRKEGLWSFYRLRPAETCFHGKLLECLDHCFAGVPGLAADRARAAKIKASGGCCPKHPATESTMAASGCRRRTGAVRTRS